ncbi:hypothetical protein C8Q76DRAFT_801037 [Earliella scabrosa]|nr:hypothetical protein C8Q76DRAFT_801037 [Earliella scabrosa]
MASRTYIRIPNVTLVFSSGGRRPRTEIGVKVYLVDTYSARWLLIEFPYCRAEDLPFPTGTLQSRLPVLVNKLSKGFTFEYCRGDRVCRWTVSSRTPLICSLVFFFPEDYDAFKSAMDDIGPQGRCLFSRPPTVTNVASMTTRASLTLKEIFRQLEVACLPIVEEEGDDVE